VLFSVASAVVTVARRRRVRPAFLAAVALRAGRQGRHEGRWVAREDPDEPTGPPPL
jgi:hypothetical protein